MNATTTANWIVSQKACQSITVSLPESDQRADYFRFARTPHLAILRGDLAISTTYRPF